MMVRQSHQHYDYISQSLVQPSVKVSFGVTTLVDIMKLLIMGYNICRYYEITIYGLQHLSNMKTNKFLEWCIPHT